MSNQELLNKILLIIPKNIKLNHSVSESGIMMVFEKNNKIIFSWII